MAKRIRSERPQIRTGDRIRLRETWGTVLTTWAPGYGRGTLLVAWDDGRETHVSQDSPLIAEVLTPTGRQPARGVVQ